MTDDAPQLIEVDLTAQPSTRAAGFSGVAGCLFFTMAMLLFAAMIVAALSGVKLEVKYILLAMAILMTLSFLAAYMEDRASTNRMRRPIDHLLREHPQLSLGWLMQQACPDGDAQRKHKRLQLFARTSAALGRVSKTIRDCPPPHRTPIHPIATPFEPHALHQPGTLFGRAREPLEFQLDTHLPEPQLPEPHVNEGSKSTRLERIAKKKDILMWVGLLAFLLAAQAPSLAQGKIIETLLFFGLMVLFALLYWGHVSGLLQRRQWFVVPTGLVLREARLASTTWNVHVFQRPTSVLIAHRQADNQWSIFVANAEIDRSLIVTGALAEFLLRAWLSPLPPPSVEQLSDLT